MANWSSGYIPHDPKPWKCEFPQCTSVGFSSKSNLKRHVSKQHTFGSITPVCETSAEMEEPFSSSESTDAEQSAKNPLEETSTSSAGSITHVQMEMEEAFNPDDYLMVNLEDVKLEPDEAVTEAVTEFSPVDTMLQSGDETAEGHLSPVVISPLFSGGMSPDMTRMLDNLLADPFFEITDCELHKLTGEKLFFIY